MISNLIKRISTDDSEQTESKSRTQNSLSRKSSRSGTSHNNDSVIKRLNDSTDGSELAEDEIIPSGIARDVEDILANDSDHSDTGLSRAQSINSTKPDVYDYYQIGQHVMQEVLVPDSNHFITKKYDIQSFDEELMGHRIYKAIDKKTPAIFQPFLKWLYQNYYSAYSFARREFSIVTTLFWIYKFLGFMLALTIKYLDILADIWRITVTGLISLVLKSDEVLTKVLDDRPRRKVN